MCAKTWWRNVIYGMCVYDGRLSILFYTVSTISTNNNVTSTTNQRTKGTRQSVKSNQINRVQEGEYVRFCPLIIVDVLYLVACTVVSLINCIWSHTLCSVFVCSSRSPGAIYFSVVFFFLYHLSSSLRWWWWCCCYVFCPTIVTPTDTHYLFLAPAHNCILFPYALSHTLLIQLDSTLHFITPHHHCQAGRQPSTACQLAI